MFSGSLLFIYEMHFYLQKLIKYYIFIEELKKPIFYKRASIKEKLKILYIDRKKNLKTDMNNGKALLYIGKLKKHFYSKSSLNVASFHIKSLESPSIYRRV